jgi:hypothetical protein
LESPAVEDRKSGCPVSATVAEALTVVEALNESVTEVAELKVRIVAYSVPPDDPAPDTESACPTCVAENGVPEAVVSVADPEAIEPMAVSVPGVAIH